MTMRRAFARGFPFARAALTAAAAAAVLPGQLLAAQIVNVHLDQAHIERLPDGVATIVVGNPLIADVSLQQGGLMVLTGKGYGTTNVIALDRSGKVLSEQFVQVQGPAENTLVLYRGMDRETYSCTPQCERRITLGDAPAFFDATIGQAGVRSTRAQGAGTATTQGAAPAR